MGEQQYVPTNRVAEFFGRMAQTTKTARKAATPFKALADRIKFECEHRQINPKKLYKAMCAVIGETAMPAKVTIDRAVRGTHTTSDETLEVIAKFFGYSPADSIKHDSHVTRRRAEFREAAAEPRVIARLAEFMDPIKKAADDDLPSIQKVVAELYEKPRIGPLLSFVVYWMKQEIS